MGKPTATDLQLGLATAPVLFACEQVKENVKKGIPLQFFLYGCPLITRI